MPRPETYQRNIEHYREYRREYYKRNRVEMLRKQKERLKDPIKRKKRNETVAALQRQWSSKFKELFDNRCILCGKDLSAVKTNEWAVHELFGRPHSYHRNRKQYEFLVKHKDDFRLFCSECHTGVIGL